MKSILFFSTIFLAIAARKCRGDEKVPAIPSCIQARIQTMKEGPKWNPPGEVWEYEYNGRTVYYFSSDCCDQFNSVVDGECNYICAPSGGITGKGDRKCDEFNASAKKIRLLWKDERK